MNLEDSIREIVAGYAALPDDQFSGSQIAHDLALLIAGRVDQASEIVRRLADLYPHCEATCFFCGAVEGWSDHDSRIFQHDPKCLYVLACAHVGRPMEPRKVAPPF